MWARTPLLRFIRGRVVRELGKPDHQMNLDHCASGFDWSGIRHRQRHGSLWHRSRRMPGDFGDFDGLSESGARQVGQLPGLGFGPLPCTSPSLLLEGSLVSDFEAEAMHLSEVTEHGGGCADHFARWAMLVVDLHRFLTRKLRPRPLCCARARSRDRRSECSGIRCHGQQCEMRLRACR